MLQCVMLLQWVMLLQRGHLVTIRHVVQRVWLYLPRNAVDVDVAQRVDEWVQVAFRGEVEAGFDGVFDEILVFVWVVVV